MSFLFVYGTLKRGHCNHHLLEDSVLVSKGCTKEKYRMLDLEYFPGVLKEGSVSGISGELYDVNIETLNVLDVFEGKWFFRDEVLLENGFKADMYFLSSEVPYEKYPVIESGKWVDKNNNL